MPAAALIAGTLDDAAGSRSPGSEYGDTFNPDRSVLSDDDVDPGKDGARDVQIE